MKKSFKILVAALIINSVFCGRSDAQYISSGDLGVGLIVAEDPSQQILNLYKVGPDGSAKLLQSDIFPESSLNTFSASKSIVDTSTGKIYLKEPDQGGGLRYRVYNAATNEFEGYTTITNLPSGTSPSFLGAPIQLNKVARREGDELHIGENSFITRERNGKQEIYARDANGNAIPLNVTNGSDLLINGKSVQGQIDDNRQNINDLGSGIASATALTAALSSLPVAAGDAPVSCGVGTGVYSSRFALGIGCASKVNERVSVNIGGSHVFGGSSSYGGGSLDTIAARAGFIFKLGAIPKSAKLHVEELQLELDNLKKDNISIQVLNRSLLERVERLEKLANGRGANS